MNVPDGDRYGPGEGGHVAWSQSHRLSASLRSFADATSLRFRCGFRVDGAAESVLFDELETGSGPLGSLERRIDDARIELTWAEDTERADELARLLDMILAEFLTAERDLDAYRRELMGRYEEITLLTSMSDTLGSIIHLEEAVASLLGEVADVLGAHAAGLWTVNAGLTALERFAACGSLDQLPNRVPLEAGSELADVFTRQVAVLAAPDVPREFPACAELPYVVVPVRYSPARGDARSVGVLALCGRTSAAAFSDSDLKLVSAIANQLAAAVENSRLVRETVRRERLMTELELAHDLQLKLLPDLANFADIADVWARCEPIESVGGDFYQLIRRPDGRLGVMLGDVSSHGYSAGLIMALTMSAARIMAREKEEPADVLRGIHHELVRKLESTDMFMSLCYVLLDPDGDHLLYANAGHPHAWLVSAERTERLTALNPPLGIAEFDAYAQRKMSWTPGHDALVMFTDGLSECLRTDELWSDARITDRVVEFSDSSAKEIVDLLFEMACAPGEGRSDDRTALVVK